MPLLYTALQSLVASENKWLADYSPQRVSVMGCAEGALHGNSGATCMINTRLSVRLWSFQMW
jgi:hypothetical protein